MRDESDLLKRELATLVDETCEFLGSFRPGSWLTTVAATAAFCSVLILSNFAIATPVGRFVDVLHAETGGWLSPQLLYPSCALGLMWIAFSRVGGLGWRDVGWRGSALLPAIVTVVVFWSCAQGSLWLVNELGPGEPTWRWGWRGGGGAVLAALNAQLLGNSLAEETLFRGYLLPQVYLRAVGSSRRSVAVIAGLLAPLALSVLIHLPRLVHEEGLVGADLTEPLFWSFRFGMALSLVFLVTRNLFLCVGLHALWNVGPTLFEVPRHHLDLTWWVCVGLLIVGWTLGRNRQGG